MKEGETVNKWGNGLKMTRGGWYSFGSDHLPRSLTATPLVGSELPNHTGQSPVGIWVECAGWVPNVVNINNRSSHTSPQL